VFASLTLRARPPPAQALAATPSDSQERFEARKLWPGFAKRLRQVCDWCAPTMAS
jgi:hypothetical protein